MRAAAQTADAARPAQSKRGGVTLPHSAEIGFEIGRRERHGDLSVLGDNNLQVDTTSFCVRYVTLIA